MLLQKIKLNNIRSYSEQEIIFPEGSILLSGDIGAGKSSLLLAIEFALFGTSRPDLPAEALLRKGTTQGSVELDFKINEQEIRIKRNLKKDKDTIKQTSGHLIINNNKKELTAVELKAEIISLLGYPEDVLAKNKNYIYRYTVYCPQEEMRYILQENPELRLDSLRKIFNVDKYKNIRESLQLVLKKMRQEISFLQTKLEPFAEIKNNLILVEEEENSNKLQLVKLQPQLLAITSSIKSEKEELNKLEQEQRFLDELRQRKQTNEAIISNQQQRLNFLQVKITETKSQTADKNLVKTEEQLRILEEEKNNYLSQKSRILANLQNLQKKIQELQEEGKVLQKKIVGIEEKAALKNELILAINKEEESKAKDAQLKQLLETLLRVIVQNETILAEAQRVKEQVINLNECPTCLQEVSAEYKFHVLEKENLKIEQALKLRQESEEQKREVTRQKIETEEKLREINYKKSLLSKIEAEISQLEEKRERFLLVRGQLLGLVQENNTLMKMLSEFKEEKIAEINIRIKQLLEIKQAFIYELDLFKRVKQLQEEMVGLEEKQAIILQQLKEYQEGKQTGLNESFDLAKTINNKKTQLSFLMEQEKEFSIQQAQLLTISTHHQKQKESLEAEVRKLNELNSRLIRQQGLYLWLEEYFLNLTYAIEKQMMLQIHHSFNTCFQEWFSILMDDEEVTSRIDDSFTPIIEQNGYEISFSNLSGGEKTSAALAYRLALNRVINDVVHEIKTKELLILDEPTDGFSSEQLDKVREVLDRLKLKQMIIVSHESKIESFVENVIRIGKNEMRSRVV